MEISHGCAMADMLKGGYVGSGLTSEQILSLEQCVQLGQSRHDGSKQVGDGEDARTRVGAGRLGNRLGNSPDSRAHFGLPTWCDLKTICAPSNPIRHPNFSRIESLCKLDNLNHSRMPDFQAFINPRNEVTYPASCHCGKSRFTITIPSLDTITVTSCNCSICQINGYLNVYPLRKNVSFQSPYEELGSYAFASQTLVHKFCRTCGTSLLIDFGRAEEEGMGEHYAVNV